MRRNMKFKNGCDNTAIEALRYLADYEKPIGGSSRFNTEHLLQIADELEASISQDREHEEENDGTELEGVIEDLEFFLQDRDEEHKAEKSGAAYARRCEADTIHRKLKRLKAKVSE
jgi:hypothetical protein